MVEDADVMKKHFVELWCEDLTGQWGWICHTCGEESIADSYKDAGRLADGHLKSTGWAPEMH